MLSARIRGGAATMYLIAWLILFGLLFYIAQQALNSQSNVESKVSVLHGEMMRVSANQMHQYRLPCQINGVTVKCLIDTGATHVSIPDRYASRMNLKRTATYRARTANGDVTVYGTDIAELKFGIFTLKDIKGSLNPAMQDEVLLGMSALKHLDWHVEGGDLYLAPPAPMPVEPDSPDAP